VLLHQYGVSAHMNAIISTFATLLLRLAGIRWKIQLPMFRPKAAAVGEICTQRPVSNHH
jgi:uncharacterized membrane protein YeiH